MPIMSAAPIKSMVARPASAATRKGRMRERADEVRVKSRSEICAFREVMRSAGQRPNSAATASDTRHVKPRTAASIPTWSIRGMKVGFDWTRTRSANHANPLPSNAPQDASSALSVSIWLTRRERDAPSARRTAPSNPHAPESACYRA